MSKYVDGYVLPVAKKNLPAYLRMARVGARLWRKHGALEFRECVADDLHPKQGRPFTGPLKLKRGETVVFSWIVFKSRAHRDRVNAKVLQDLQRADMDDPKAMPFDCQRMLYAGFDVMVDA